MIDGDGGGDGGEGQVFEGRKRTTLASKRLISPAAATEGLRASCATSGATEGAAGGSTSIGAGTSAGLSSSPALTRSTGLSALPPCLPRPFFFSLLPPAGPRSASPPPHLSFPSGFFSPANTSSGSTGLCSVFSFFFFTGVC